MPARLKFAIHAERKSLGSRTLVLRPYHQMLMLPVLHKHESKSIYIFCSARDIVISLIGAGLMRNKTSEIFHSDISEIL